MSADAKQQAPAVNAQKGTKKAKVKAPVHPSFKDMINEAIKQLNDPNGVSRKAIKKYIEDKHSPKNVTTYLNKNLAKMTTDGQLKHPKRHPGKYAFNTDKTEKKPKAPKKEKKPKVEKPKEEKKAKKEARPKKTAEQKKKVKSAKKTSVKKSVQKKAAKGPPSPKKSGEPKKGRGRPKKAK